MNGPVELAASLPILFSTDALLAIGKPSGLAVHPGLAQGADSVVEAAARLGFGRLHPVHRLDRATSGVLLLAKHADAARTLGRAFEERRVQKRYLAIVRGAPPEGELVVDHAIPKDEGAERVPALTRLRRLAVATLVDSPLREQRYAVVEARPETGRFHQIRRHTKHLGHPILGDTTYGRSEHNAFVRERAGLSRLALHAVSITLLWEGEVLEIIAPPPSDLASAAERLGFPSGVLA